jgi:hypothetical protein
MYEERKKSREQQNNSQLQRLGYIPTLMNPSSRRGSIDNVYYGVGGDFESASSTRCSTPNRLMGSMSKIPVWTGSQEKLNNLRQTISNNNSSLQKTPTTTRMLPPIPNKITTSASGNKMCGTSKVKKLASKKWESCSSLESTMDTTGQFLQDPRYKSTPKGKPSRNSELTEKSRQLTESLKQLQQSYSSSNIQVS